MDVFVIRPVRDKLLANGAETGAGAVTRRLRRQGQAGGRGRQLRQPQRDRRRHHRRSLLGRGRGGGDRGSGDGGGHRGGVPVLAEQDGGVGVGQELRGPVAGEQGALADGGRAGRAQELSDDALVEDEVGTEGTFPVGGQDLLDVRGRGRRRGRVRVCNGRPGFVKRIRYEKKTLLEAPR